MKKALLVSFCLLFVLTSLVMARPATKETAQANFHIYDHATAPTFDGLFSAAAVVDTYLIAEYQFDSGGSFDKAGWTHHDLTAQPGGSLIPPVASMWHVDTYRIEAPYTTGKAMWCGHAPSTADYPWCSYAKLPGYGNGWLQYLTFDPETPIVATGDVRVTYDAVYDSEGGYDYTYFQYLDTTAVADTWVDAATYDGDDTVQAVIDIPQAELKDSSIRLRFKFESDGAWSDEDGLQNTDGAFILDHIVITDDINGTPAVVETEDWDDESVGDTQSTDGDWVGSEGAAYGDFIGLFSGLTVLQEDVCSQNLSYLWGFFNGSTYDYSCATPTPHPEQAVIPYENELGQFFNNEVWSPWIDLDDGGTVPAGVGGAILEYYDYRDRELDALIFNVWHVRTRIDDTDCPSSWLDRNFIYYGPGKFWGRVRYSCGDLIATGDQEIQIAIGALDYCGQLCGPFSGECHAHSPLVDKVKLYRVDTAGPIYSVRDIDLFQDNFPEDEGLTGVCRVDAAIDRLAYDNPNVYIGDSLVFECSEPSYGLGISADGSGRAAVYCYVRVVGGTIGTPANWEAPEITLHPEYPYGSIKRFAYQGGGASAGGFYEFHCDSSYNQDHFTATEDKFCFDLNDAFFTPPNRIDFYFGAKDGAGNWSYYSDGWDEINEPGTVPIALRADVEAAPMEMQCLPTGDSDILYVDKFSGRYAQPYFDTSFQAMGITPDRYDVRGPSSLVANGIGGRAVSGQLIDVYHKILYCTGDLGSGTVGDGLIATGEKSQDAQVLYDFLEYTTIWNPGLYISGDDVASEMVLSGGTPLLNLMTFFPYNCPNTNHVAAGYNISPLVIGDLTQTVAQGDIFRETSPAVIPDTLVAYGGCPLINDFDILEPTGTSNMAMYYYKPAVGPDPALTDCAVLTNIKQNIPEKTARVVLSGFGYNYIRDDRPTYPYDRLDHLIDIVRWFENTIEDPTGGGDTPLVNSLAQNYPNPFNPTTTIEFSIKERAHVSLKVYNVAGQLVKTLEDNVLRADVYTNYQWDGLDNNNQPVASGVYFYKLVTKNFSQTRKMVLLK